MRGFFLTVLILGGLGAAGYFLWDPFLKPMIEGDKPSMSDNSAIGTGEASKANDSSIAPKRAATARPAVDSPSTASRLKAATAKPKSEVDLLLEKRYPMPDIKPLMEIVNNWANVPPNAFPPEVFCSEPVAFELVVNGQILGSSNVGPGTPLKPVGLVGNQLQIANVSNPNQSKQVDVDKTDFKQRIKRRYDNFVKMKTSEIENMRAKVKQVVEGDPGKLALLKGERPPAVAASSASDPRFGPVKRSLINGDVASVKAEEAQSFAWNGSETVGGALPGTYDTVTVNFVVETIFGNFPVEYKALLKGSQIVGWIDPITEDRI
ncbi:MAG: hypothetical protein CMO61_12135 [Verrucomicrobiales bacterium]|nr:hypothetical protein [Verrucomicrobiales bacterium]